MSFFKSVFLGGTSKQAPASTPTEPPDSFDSMFAGLSLKPRLAEPEPHSSDTDQPAMPGPEPQPSAFSFVQASSSFSFIAEEPLQRSSSDLVPDLKVNGGYLPQAVNRRHTSDPINAKSDSTRDEHYRQIEAKSGNLNAISHESDLVPDPTMENGSSLLEEAHSEPVLSPNPNNLSVETSPDQGSDRWQSEMQKFAKTLSDLMMDHWKFMRECNDSHSNFEAQYKSLLQSLSEVNGDVEALKIAQQKAVEDEAYDRADELDSNIQQLQGNIEEIKDRIKVVNCSKLEITRRSQLQIEQLESSVDEVFSGLLKLKGGCFKEAHEIVESSSTQLQDREEHLKEDSVRISNLLEIINDDLNRIQNEHDGVRAAIHEKTKDAQGEKDSICSDIQAIDEELARLKEQIRLKELERTRLHESLSDIDQKISQAGAAFDRQLMRIENQRLRIEADRGDILKEQEELALSENQLRLEKQRIAELEESATKFSEVIDQIISDRKQQLVSVIDTVHLYGQVHERIQALEQAWEEAQLRLAEQDRKSRLLSSQQISIKGDIEKHEALVNETDRQLPELEDQKAHAVSSRDFKSAGILAKQLKQLAASRTDSIESIEKLKKDLDIVNGSILNHEASLLEARVQFETAEQELDRLKFEHIHEQITSLSMSKVGASCEELEVIEAHLNQLSSLAETIGRKHSWELKEVFAEPSPSPVPSCRSPALCNESPRSCSPLSRSSPQISHSKSSYETVLPTSDQSETANGLSPSQRLAEIEMAIESLEDKLQKAIASDDYDQADLIQTDVNKLSSEREAIQAVFHELNSEMEEAVADRAVTEDAVSCESQYGQECDDGRCFSVSPGRQSSSQPDDNVKERFELPGHTDG